MNQKFVRLLEELDEEALDENIMSKQRASALLKRYKDGEASPDDVKALKQWGFLTKDGEVKINVSESKEDLDEGRGRPKKEIDPDAPVKEKGKRGRPKGDVYDDEDDESQEGKRDLTLHAFIRGGKGKNKQEATESKTIKGAKPDDIKKLVQDFENVLTVKFANKWDFSEDEINCEIRDNLGWTGKPIDSIGKDDDGTDSEDDSYDFGRKEK